MFNDASGTRASAIQWGSRIFLALVVLLGTALALTLSTHVSVPGLERLVPGLDAKEVRPVVRTVPSDPSERANVATGSGSTQPRPTTQPPTSRASVSTADARKSVDARRAVGTTVPSAAEPSSASSVRPTTVVPTASARPTVRAGGQGTVKPRNPKAATPSPPDQQAPGQTRTPDPRPTTDSG